MKAADQYPLAELVAFLGALRTDVEFLAPDDFVTRARRHFAEGAAHPEVPFGLVKLDIHRDIKRTAVVARALSGAKVRGLFLMMHRHPFNDAWYDAAETWDILSSLRDQGHEVGLHLDPFHLIRKADDLIGALAAAVEDFRRRGIAARCATLHGDTRKHIVACGLSARDFFVEEKSRSKWNGAPPEGEGFFAEHVGRYSYADIAAATGIEHFAEAAYRHRGDLLAPHPLVYVTDNNRSLQVRNIPDNGGTRVLDAGAQFRIPADFAPKAFEVLREHPFVALFHPQWFA